MIEVRTFVMHIKYPHLHHLTIPLAKYSGYGFLLMVHFNRIQTLSPPSLYNASKSKRERERKKEGKKTTSQLSNISTLFILLSDFGQSQYFKAIKHSINRTSKFEISLDYCPSDFCVGSFQDNGSRRMEFKDL